jgi:hypothetical protein
VLATPTGCSATVVAGVSSLCVTDLIVWAQYLFLSRPQELKMDLQPRERGCASGITRPPPRRLQCGSFAWRYSSATLRAQEAN